MSNLPLHAAAAPFLALGAPSDDDPSPDSPVADPDAPLLAAIHAGRLDRFDDFVNRYKTRLLRYLYTRLGNLDAAEDLTQEVFLRLFRTPPDARPAARVSTWLFTVARNCLTDHLRTQRRARRLFHALIRLTPRDSTLDPHTSAALQDEHARVAALLARLPDDQREVLSLRLFADLSLAQIADITQSPLPTVKSRLRYALAKIASLLPTENPP